MRCLIWGTWEDSAYLDLEFLASAKLQQSYRMKSLLARNPASSVNLTLAPAFQHILLIRKEEFPVKVLVARSKALRSFNLGLCLPDVATAYQQKQ